MPRMFKRYNEPAIMPQTPGMMDLFQEDRRSYKINKKREDYLRLRTQQDSYTETYSVVIYLESCKIYK